MHTHTPRAPDPNLYTCECDATNPLPLQRRRVEAHKTNITTLPCHQTACERYGEQCFDDILNATLSDLEIDSDSERPTTKSDNTDEHPNPWSCLPRGPLSDLTITPTSTHCCPYPEACPAAVHSDSDTDSDMERGTVVAALDVNASLASSPLPPPSGARVERQMGASRSLDGTTFVPEGQPQGSSGDTGDSDGTFEEPHDGTSLASSGGFLFGNGNIGTTRLGGASPSSVHGTTGLGSAFFSSVPGKALQQQPPGYQPVTNTGTNHAPCPPAAKPTNHPTPRPPPQQT